MLSRQKAGFEPRRWAYATLPKQLDLEASDFTTAGPWSRFWSLEVRVTLCVRRQDRRRIEPTLSWFRSAVGKGQNIAGQALAVCDGKAVRRLFVHLERAARDELGGLLRGRAQWIDQILVAVDDQGRHGDGAHI